MTSNGGCRRHVEPLKLRRWPRGRLSFGTMRHWLSCEMGIIGRKLPQESCINSCCNRFGYGKKCKNQISLHCVILILVSIRGFPATSNMVFGDSSVSQVSQRRRLHTSVSMPRKLRVPNFASEVTSEVDPRGWTHGFRPMASSHIIPWLVV